MFILFAELLSRGSNGYLTQILGHCVCAHTSVWLYQPWIAIYHDGVIDVLLRRRAICLSNVSCSSVISSTWFTCRGCGQGQWEQTPTTPLSCNDEWDNRYACWAQSRLGLGTDLWLLFSHLIKTGIRLRISSPFFLFSLFFVGSRGFCHGRLFQRFPYWINLEQEMRCWDNRNGRIPKLSLRLSLLPLS